ncbi:response regulator transcription factor [candidate division KSB1 bacterium]|nr:response regulator transcription factor [candidate division KSB1 bacterium]
MIHVLIADDHAIVRKGLIQILRDAPDGFEVDEASSGQEVLEKIEANKYDVIVLDITMPGRSGLDILSQIKVQYPTLPVLILSMHPEDQYAVRVLKAGASGYLMKESAPEELIQAVRKVASGSKYITATVAERLVVNLEKGSEKSPHEKLSDREFEVLLLLAKGNPVKDIAEKLFISAKTVHTYRSRILEKMQMKGTAELIHYAIQNQLVD